MKQAFWVGPWCTLIFPSTVISPQHALYGWRGLFSREEMVEYVENAHVVKNRTELTDQIPAT